MKEAMLYGKFKDKVKCNLCSHHCVIADGKRGICGVRQARGEKLYSLNYGKPISTAVDPIEKKPLFHFLPGSLAYSVACVGCNFSCLFCQNHEISQMPKNNGPVIGEEVSPENIVDAAKSSGCASISYTYTEPTIFFEYAYDIAKLAHAKGLKNNFVTNGYMTKEAIDTISPYLDAANVDLKGFSEDFYRKIIGAKLRPVLDSIKYMHEKNIFLEITTLIVPSHNDDEKSLNKIAEFIASVDDNIPWHISRFYPHFKMQDVAPTDISAIHKAIEIGKKKGVKYIYAGNVPGDDFESTYCPSCGKKVIERYGYRLSSINLKEKKCGFCGEEINIIV